MSPGSCAVQVSPPSVVRRTSACWAAVASPTAQPVCSSSMSTSFRRRSAAPPPHCVSHVAPPSGLCSSTPSPLTRSPPRTGPAEGSPPATQTSCPTLSTAYSSVPGRRGLRRPGRAAVGRVLDRAGDGDAGRSPASSPRSRSRSACPRRSPLRCGGDLLPGLAAVGGAQQRSAGAGGVADPARQRLDAEQVLERRHRGVRPLDALVGAARDQGAVPPLAAGDPQSAAGDRGERVRRVGAPVRRPRRLPQPAAVGRAQHDALVLDVVVAGRPAVLGVAEVHVGQTVGRARPVRERHGRIGLAARLVEAQQPVPVDSAGRRRRAEERLLLVGSAVLRPVRAGPHPDGEPREPAHVGPAGDAEDHAVFGVTHRLRRRDQARVEVEVVAVDDAPGEHAEVQLPAVPGGEARADGPGDRRTRTREATRRARS